MFFRALGTLDISNNGLFGFRDMSGDVKVFAEAIKSNSTITDLNLAQNNINGGDAKVLSVAISANRAPLTNLDISNNNLGGGYFDDGGRWMTDCMTGVKALAAAISECK